MTVYLLRALYKMPIPPRRLFRVIATLLSTSVASTPAAQTLNSAGTPQFRSTEVLRISGDATNLSDISFLATCCGGRTALLQSQDRHIRLFGPRGERVRTIGRGGAGPGEFDLLDAFGTVGDSIWAFDLRLRRVTLFDPNGSVKRTAVLGSAYAPLPDTRRRILLRFARPLALYADGSVLAITTTLAVENGLTDGPPPRDWLIRIDPRDTANPVRRFVVQLPTDSGTQYRFFGPSSQIGASVPFFASPLKAVAPDGQRIAILVTSRNAAEPFVHLHVVTANGDTAVHVRMPFKPEAIPRAALDSALAARLSQATPRHRDLYDQVVKPLLPSFYPPVRSMLMGADRSIWLRLRSAAGKSEWLKLDERGTPVGRLVLSQDESLLAADADGVWIRDGKPDIPDAVRLNILR